MRLLVVEDEPDLRNSLVKALREDGYAVDDAADGEEGLYKAEGCDYDAVVLDIMLPRLDGREVLRRLRQSKKTPVMMLTARGSIRDRVHGLDSGADDYLAKPFDLRELSARIEALLRRSALPAGNSPEIPGRYSFGKVTVDFESAVVTRDGRPVQLTAQEYRLLSHFIARRGRLLSRAAILDEVWGYEAEVATRTVDVHVAALRQKLEENPVHPRWIVTMRGMGYRFTG
jgi:DNA-binding response OmpR family regulator